MEEIKPEPIKAFMAVLYSREASPEDVAERLKERIGPIDFQSQLHPFERTDYYEEEMGCGLRRGLLSFRDLCHPSDLIWMKLTALVLEKEWSEGGRRKVNLDPGYLDYTKVVLASCKPGGWKIYLDRGVFADMTLYYEKGIFLRFGWTFPDFREGQYDRDLLAIRSRYKKQRREGQP